MGSGFASVPGRLEMGGLSKLVSAGLSCFASALFSGVAAGGGFGGPFFED